MSEFAILMGVSVRLVRRNVACGNISTIAVGKYRWMTAEESVAIASDAAAHQHLGEEIADVLLYLLQIADHSGVDVTAAVERKLTLNALKHPVP